MKFKKLVKMSLAMMLVFGTSVAVSGCGKDKDNSTVSEAESQQYKIYKLAKEAGVTDLTYEEWLLTVKGPRGEKGETGDTGPSGAAGKDGKDGASWLNGTTVPNSSAGKNGDFYINTETNVIYKKTNDTWVVITEIKDGAAGKDGVTPYIGTDGYWYVNNHKTSILAEGKNGVTPEIKDGYWWIDGVNTNVKAEGTTGAGIEKIEETGRNGKEVTYTITYTDGDTSTFTVNDGENGVSITNASLDSEGNLLLTFSNSQTPINVGKVKGNDGKGIVSVSVTSEGLVDTYTVNYTDGTNFKFTVTNGKDGTVWKSDEGNPNDNNTIGELNDFYFDTLNDDIYRYTADGWVLEVDLEDTRIDDIVLKDNVTYSGSLFGRSFELVLTTGDDGVQTIETLNVEGFADGYNFRPEISIKGEVITVSVYVPKQGTSELVRETVLLTLGENNHLVAYVSDEEHALIKGVYSNNQYNHLTLGNTTFALSIDNKLFKGTYEIAYGDADEGSYILTLMAEDKTFNVGVSYFYRSFNVIVEDYSDTYKMGDGTTVVYNKESNTVKFGDEETIEVSNAYEFESVSDWLLVEYEKDGMVNYGVLEYLSGNYYGAFVEESVFNILVVGVERPEFGSTCYILDEENGEISDGYANLSYGDYEIRLDINSNYININSTNGYGLYFYSSLYNFEEIEGAYKVVGYDNENGTLATLTFASDGLTLKDVRLDKAVSNTTELMREIEMRTSNIALIQDVDLPLGLTINYNLNFNLNGHTLSAKNDNVGDGVFYVVSGGYLTIDDTVGGGVIDGVNSTGWAMAVWANGGTVVINDGKFTNVGAGSDDQYDLIYAKNGGTVIINGGTFMSQTPRWTLNVRNDTAGEVIVNGGTFYNFDPSGANTDDTIPEGGKNPVNYVSAEARVYTNEIDENNSVYMVIDFRSADIYESIEANVKYIDENAYNLPGGTNVNEKIEDINFYTIVGNIEGDYEFDTITINGFEFNKNSAYFSVGNNNFLTRAAWKVDEFGDLHVASLLLKTFASAPNGVITITNEYGYEREIIIPMYTMSSEYEDVSLNGVYKGTDLSETQEALDGYYNGEYQTYQYATSNGQDTIRFKVGSADYLSTSKAFTIKILTNSEGKKVYQYGYTTLDKIGDEYYVAFYPSYSKTGYEETMSYNCQYMFVLDNGTYGSYSVDITLEALNN